MDVIIPTRGVEQSKRRLRKQLGDKRTNKLVKELLVKTIEELQACKIISRIIILTPQPETLSQLFSEEKERKPDIQADQSNNLNSSLGKLWQEVLKGKIATRERVILLMPDIPSINCRTIKKFVQLTPQEKLGLFPLKQEGTAMVLLNKTVHPSFKPKFGEKSLRKFLLEARKRGRATKVFSTEKELIDIDELADLKKWVREKESQSKKEEELKRKWKKELEKNG